MHSALAIGEQLALVCAGFVTGMMQSWWPLVLALVSVAALETLRLTLIPLRPPSADTAAAASTHVRWMVLSNAFFLIALGIFVAIKYGP